MRIGFGGKQVAIALQIAAVGFVYLCAACTVAQEMPPIAPTVASQGPLHVSNAVIAGNIETAFAPVYPPDAKAQHVQGVVVIHATISSIGTIEKLQVISGPESLRKSAIDAVTRWKYKTYLLNGQPVEVETNINVNFTFAGTGKKVAPQTSNPVDVASGEPVHVPSGTVAGLLISRVEPVLPNGVHGGVSLLRVTISKTGSVEDVQMVSGRNELASSLMDAVKQWKYEPYLVDGAPVEVQTTISIEFTSGGGPEPQVPSPDAGLTDRELFDKGTEDMKSGNDEDALYALQLLLDRYPGSQDQSRARNLPGATQTLLRQANIKYLSLQASLEYFADTGVRLRRIGGTVSAPVVTYQVEPEFSAKARQEKQVSASVLVNLIVDENGRPQNVHVLRAVGMGLDEKVVAAVRQYKFKPAMEDGKPVQVMLNIEINFTKF